jgi:hypothetical protein
MKIYRFNEFDAIDESLPNKNTIDQLMIENFPKELILVIEFLI